VRNPNARIPVRLAGRDARHHAARGQLAGTIKPATALAFPVVQMTFVPCVATIAAIRQETHLWKWTAFSVELMLVISLAAGALAYQVGRLL
jgi:ferrous iron transport protein B